MNKLDIIFQKINFTKEDSFKNSKIKKVSLNPSTFTYKIFIQSPLPIDSEAIKELEEKFLEYPKDFRMHLVFDDVSNKECFQKYWDELFSKTFVGKQLNIINAVPDFDGEKLSIKFNLKTQMKQFTEWKETMEKELSKLGYAIPITFALKENTEEFKEKIKLQTKKMLDDKIMEAKLIRMSSTQQNSESKQMSLYRSLSKNATLKIVDIDSAEIKKVTIKAQITEIDARKIPAKNLIIYKIGLFDKTKAINGKYFFRTTSKNKDKCSGLKIGDWIKLNGKVEYDTFEKELAIILNNVVKIEKPVTRKDEALQKRVEFSVATKMSAFDGLAKPADMIEAAINFGHQGIAFADQNNVQAYPEIMSAADAVKEKHPDFKIIYGAKLKTIESKLDLIVNPHNTLIEEAEFVVFDIETTGLSSHYDQMIEFGAVKIKNGIVIDKLHFFSQAEKKVSSVVKELTGITQEMVDNGIPQAEAADKIKNFFGNATLVAHNANFDISFMKKLYINHNKGLLENPWIDTLHLAWAIMAPRRSYRLGKIAPKWGVFYDEKAAHRADYDADVLKTIFLSMIKNMEVEHNVKTVADFASVQTNDSLVKQFGFNTNLYAKNQQGIKDIYELISKAHIDYVGGNKTVAIPKEEIANLRDNLMVGASPSNSELFELALNKNNYELQKAIEFYDFIMISPPKDYYYLVEKQIAESKDVIHDVINRIITEAERKNKIVIASSEPLYLDPEDKSYWEIFIETERLGGVAHPLKDYQNRIKTLPDKHFKTTNELMLDFDFLPQSSVMEIVVRNATALLESFDNDIEPLKKGLFVPEILDSKEKLTKICYENAYKKYGNPLPGIVAKRLEKELKPICDQNFDTVYYISHLIVKKSLEDGYLVGSRGSVGSSIVATLSNITEVNPLPPHYVCKCTYSNFDINDDNIMSGFDLAPIDCPKCGLLMYGEGHDIPFETFLGFEADKIPDIDLNFSNLYQNHAHEYTKELFGEKNVFRAGTISTVQSRTAFGFVKNHQEITMQDVVAKAETDRLVSGLVGTKRTTGQHPGGIMVLPKKFDITDFTPVNYPANEKSDWITTHFDYHSIHNNLLKLDLLGHVDPTAIRMLQDITGVDPKDIPFYDEKTIAIFSGLSSLNLKYEMPISETTGCIGIPEFGTSFVRKMLAETKPKSFNELIILSGLSHGTGVYRGNSRELILKKDKKMQDVIGCRDDIMLFLIRKGLSNKDAFDIMEFIRKGMIEHEPARWQTYVQKMQEHGVENWWIESCGKINYLFPKAHATAYVMMAWRVAWFKVYYPLEYYAALYTLRCDAFDMEVISKGSDYVLEKYNALKSIYSKNKGSMTVKDADLLKTLEMCIEMFARGYRFSGIDINSSGAKNFKIDYENQKIIIPFVVVDGLGPSVAQSIVEARNEKSFSSIKDITSRTKINKTSIETLRNLGVLKTLPNSDQLTIFDL